MTTLNPADFTEAMLSFTVSETGLVHVFQGTLFRQCQVLPPFLGPFF